MSKKFEIPEVLSNKSNERLGDESYIATWVAAGKYGKHLNNAVDDLMLAKDLAKTLTDSLEASHDSLGFRAATVVNEIVERLNKAYSRLDKHDTRYRNLFIAYFDLKAAGGAS